MLTSSPALGPPSARANGLRPAVGTLFSASCGGSGMSVLLPQLFWGGGGGGGLRTHEMTK